MNNIIEKLIEFRNKRGWQGYHTGLNLSHKLMIESAELAELFEWNQLPNRKRLKEEIGDVLIIVLYLCEKHNIDPIESVLSKIEMNNEKYPEDYENQNWRKR